MKIGFLVCVDEIIERNQMFGVRYMPVWAYTLSAYVKDIPGITVFLHDTRLKSKEETPDADLFFISGINQDYDSLVAYFYQLRRMHPTARVVLGGPIIASYKMAGRLSELEMFDHLFMGDGENHVKDLVLKVRDGGRLERLIENHKKFDLIKARTMDAALIKETYADYYGAVIEVSRGCPFLCEFCDIRTKPDNNWANNKKISVIVEEVGLFCSLGVGNFLLACDNFLGTPSWAEEFCDNVIEWKEKTGHSPRFYTWLTINIAYHPRIMAKMRLAGFDMFFIGIESFGTNQLLETAKLQNAKADITECVRTIQSYGFIIVAGLIFGFDTDPDDVVKVSLEGIRNSGLISGDPSLLTALPGTPLYRRMELSGRLRKSKLGLGGKKYMTNIFYLRPRDRMIDDFIQFVEEFNTPSFQLARYENFLRCLGPASRRVSSKSYVNPGVLLKLVAKDKRALLSVIHRFWGVINSPSKINHVLRAISLTISSPFANMSYFYFWLFNWSNSVLKYGSLSKADFDIASIERSPVLIDVIPDGYESDYFEPIPASKIRSQRQATIKTLTRVFSDAQ
jgi:radical SAM superfamily enzyme YgiQ (UPF0313 family)